LHRGENPVRNDEKKESKFPHEIPLDKGRAYLRKKKKKGRGKKKKR